MCKPFTNILLNLTETVEVRGLNTVKNKLKANLLYLLFLNNVALHAQLMHKYSTPAFLLQ